MREGLAVSDSVLVWVRWLSRDLTPLGRYQHLVCWDCFGLPPFPHGLRQEKENEVTEGRGQKLLGIQMGILGSTPGVGLSKGQGSPLLYSCCLGPFSHHLPI